MKEKKRKRRWEEENDERGRRDDGRGQVAGPPGVGYPQQGQYRPVTQALRSRRPYQGHPRPAPQALDRKPFFTGFRCRWCSFRTFNKDDITLHNAKMHVKVSEEWARTHSIAPIYKEFYVDRSTGVRVKKFDVPESWLRWLPHIRELYESRPQAAPVAPLQPQPPRQAQSASPSVKAGKRPAPTASPNVGKRFCLQVALTTVDGRVMYEMVPEPPVEQSYAEVVAQPEARPAITPQRPRDVRPKTRPAAAAGSVLQVARDAVPKVNPGRTPLQANNHVVGSDVRRQAPVPARRAPAQENRPPPRPIPAQNPGRNSQQPAAATAPRSASSNKPAATAGKPQASPGRTATNAGRTQANPVKTAANAGKAQASPGRKARKSIACKHCPRVFTVAELTQRVTAIREHNQAVHKWKDTVFYCDECHCHFPSPELVCDHLFVEHPQLARRMNPELSVRVTFFNYRSLPFCGRCQYSHVGLFSRSLGCWCEDRRRVPTPGRPEQYQSNSGMKVTNIPLTYSHVQEVPAGYRCQGAGYPFYPETLDSASSKSEDAKSGEATAGQASPDSQETAIEAVAAAAGNLKLQDAAAPAYREPANESDSDKDFDTVMEDLRKEMEGSPMKKKKNRSRSKSSDH